MNADFSNGVILGTLLTLWAIMIAEILSSKRKELEFDLDQRVHKLYLLKFLKKRSKVFSTANDK
jgi:hypothetical protein